MGAEYFHLKLAELERQRGADAAKGSAELAQLAPLGAPSDSPGFAWVGQPDTATSIKESVLAGAAYALKPLAMGFEGLSRVSTAGKEVLLWAGQVTTTQGFKDRWKGAWDGRHKLSGREMTELLIGRDTLETLDREAFIPGWMKSVVVPEHVAAGTRIQSVPRVTVGDALSTVVDLTLDPLALLSLTPVGAGRFIPTAVKKAAAFPFKPMTRVIEGLFSPRSGSPTAAFNLLRDPENVLTGSLRPALESFRFHSSKAARNIEDLMARTEAIDGGLLKKNYHGLSDQKIGAWLHAQEATQRGGKWALTGKRGTVALSDEEMKVAQGLKAVVDSQIDELIKAGHLTPEQAKSGLKFIMPHLVGKNHIPEDIWQSWSVENLGNIHLRVRDGDVLKRYVSGGGLREISLKLENLSAVDSVHDFLYVARRKLDLEPALLEWAPKPGYTNPALKAASSWQRRYMTDLINRFQGKGRGRKHIMFDIAVGEYIDKLKSTAGGQRAVGLLEKLGYGRTVDGLPDFSPTTKLAGIMTHNIIRATLGGRLRSATQNTTQILNFGVTKGMPATLRGMYKMSSPEFSSLRKMENLRGDFTGLWSDDVWINKAGKRFDQAIFASFNAAEDVIRGTGFNLGLDEWMGKALKAGRIRDKSLGAVRQAGLLEEATRYAHMESVNGAFIYGILGRAPTLGSNPLAKVGLTLLSYPYKQAEFLRRSFTADGSAVMRFIGLHGFLIQNANEHLGVAAEDFLGWGFKPMTKSFGGVPLVTSPPVRALLDSVEALAAYGTGDMTLAEQKLSELRKNLPLAIVPAPGALAIKDIFEAKKRWETKRQEIGESFVPIAHPEVVTNFLISRSTTQRMRADLHGRRVRAMKKIDWTLDKRAKAVVGAILDPSREGDKLGEAMYAAASGISVEGKTFYPTSEQFSGRLKRYLTRRTVSRDVRDMMDSQFLDQLFLQSQLELFQRVSESGGSVISIPQGRGVQ